MHQTKLKYGKKKGNYSKTKQARVTVHVHCTPPDEIYLPTKFHTHMEICSGKNSSMKINKGQ